MGNKTRAIIGLGYVCLLLVSFYAVKVCCVEAGLRTNNKRSPFREEMNQQLTGRITDYHFTPTVQSWSNRLACPVFVWLMEKTYMIIKDSGGVQEEILSFGEPVLVMGYIFQRAETIVAGTVIFGVAGIENIVIKAKTFLRNIQQYQTMNLLHYPYDNRKAFSRSVDFINNL